MNVAFALPAVRPGAPAVDFVVARQHMVESQIEPSNIIHPTVLAAFAAVPRENYVPAALQDRAYGDRILNWEDGFLLPPTLCAQLLEEIAPRMPTHVLVVESGSGYMAALAGLIFAQVTALFPDVGPAKVALNNYAKAGYQNITVKSGLLQRGWARGAPYQAIIMAGASATIPEAWVDQLSDGGWMVGLFPDETGLVKLRAYLKMHRSLSGRTMADGSAPFLPGLVPMAKFAFRS